MDGSVTNTPTTNATTRVERDTLGEVEVPADALYGAHTVRGLENFAVSGVALAHFPALVRGLAEVKVAVALANRELGEVEPAIAEAIVTAGREVAAGRWTEHFPLPMVHGGGGTSANMNANEVVANLANELAHGAPRGAYAPVHPLDHVNRSQSTNDVFTTAMQLALVREAPAAISTVRHLADVLDAKAAEYPQLERPGRTCMQDALPVPVAGVHRAQATALRRQADAIRSAAGELSAVSLGATAVGTGFGAPEGYTEVAVRHLAAETGLALTPAADHFDVLEHFDAHLRLADALCSALVLAGKLAADLRYHSSTPVGELELPAVQVGSSCMPGKVNPVMPEFVLQISYQLRGARVTVEAAVAAGELELNIMEPVIARCLLESLRDGAGALRLFADRCVAGMRWNEAVVRERLAGSYVHAIETAKVAGYAAAAQERLGGAR
ncbi:MAG TPA: lyase family protein [Conexibacter sp.]|jgi:aspartate ammonia-lyase|nr:lyase family protein [Conexibacter sp.]